MNQTHRRKFLGAIAAAVVANPWHTAMAQTATGKTQPATKLAQKLRIVIPANPGGGWDQTGRALGSAMVSSGVVDEVEYENKGGKGGTIGLAHYAEKYKSDPNSLLMGGSVMLGAVALQRPAIDLSHIQPVARLTSDFEVLVVASASPIKNVADLAKAIKKDLKSVPIAGGSAGGVDHIFAGVLARALGASPEDLNYLPFAGGAEVVSAVMSGKAMVGISGFSEFNTQLAEGKLRAIGLSARRSMFGIPAIREQGLQVEMANWRGVFTGTGVSTVRRDEMLEAVQRATLQEAWKSTLKQNHWAASWLTGADLNSFIDIDLTTARVMVHLLKFKT